MSENSYLPTRGVSPRLYLECYIHDEMKTRERMLLFKFLVILASVSESKSAQCTQKNGLDLFIPPSPAPEKGSCEETGLGWIGRDPKSFPDNDQFFTNWTELFLQPECVEKIEVHSSSGQILTIKATKQQSQTPQTQSRSHINKNPIKLFME